MSNQAPQILPETYVLELSQANADIVHGNRNGDYTVTFSEPLNIQTGDSLSMRMASIDSQKTDSQSVVFAQPQQVSLNFSYYDKNYPVDNSAGASLLTRRPLDTPAGSFPIDYKLYTSYTESGAEQLDSIQITYKGSAPTYDGYKLGTKIDGTYTVTTTTLSILNYYAFPLFTWVDPEGNHHQSVAKPFNITSKSKTGAYDEETTTITFEAANQTDPDWKYTYCSFNTNKFDSGSKSFQPTMSNAEAAQTFRGVKFGSEKIVFMPGSLAITGVVGGVVLHFNQSISTQFGPAGGSDDEINQSNNTFAIGLKNTTSVAIPNQPRFQLMTRTAGFTLPEGRYDRNTLANLLTRKFTQVGIGDEKNAAGTAQDFTPNTNLVANTGQSDMQNIVFTEIPSGTQEKMDISQNNTYTYVNSGANLQVGARKFSIEYGQIGSTYQVSNAHQSIENPSDPGKENLAYFRTGAGTAGDPYLFNQIPASTGIVVHDMKPLVFWRDNLGLYDKWRVPLSTDENNVLYYSLDDLVDKLPQESAEITTFDPTNSRVNTQPTGDKTFIDTTTTPTKAVIGDSPVINVEGTFYLVEITGLNVAQSNLISYDENRPNISAIVSKQYDSNDIVTGFSDSAIPYVHRGAPTMLNSARVRILDPDTKQVVSTLGNRNNVFLQLTTSAPVYQPTPVAPPPKQPKTQTR